MRVDSQVDCPVLFPRSLIAKICTLQQEVPTDSFVWKDFPSNDTVITDNPKANKKGRRQIEKKYSKEEAENIWSEFSPKLHKWQSFLQLFGLWIPPGTGGGSGWHMDLNWNSSSNSNTHEVCDLSCLSRFSSLSEPWFPLFSILY